MEGSFDLFVDLIDLSELGFEHGLIGELEIFEEKFLFVGRNEMLAHECLCELLLIIS